MAEIRFISSTTVQTASRRGESTDSYRIDLTPWDLQLLLVGPIQKGLLFHKPTPSQEKQLFLLPNSTAVVDHLKSSFSGALEFFPPLAGRLGITKNDDGTSSFFINCNNAGADFVHVVAGNVTVGDILEPLHVPRIVHSFFPLNRVLNHEGTSKPLLAVQVTELVDGFFVGCTMNHAAVDGSSFWNFFNSWSELSRGFDNVTRHPVLERWFPSDIDCPIRIPFCPKQSDDDDKSAPHPFEERIFHFKREKIAGLKAKANAEMGTTSTSTISSLQALLAHLWRSTVRCQHVDSDQEVRCVLLVSARTRLKPSMLEGYFGNTVHPEVVAAAAGELLEQGLGWAAWEMNKVIARQTDDEVRNFLRCWVKSPRMLKRGSVVTREDLITSSSPRFDVYGNDFGWGKPVAVRSGSANKRGGKLTLYPGAEEGSIDVEVCLSREKLIAMGEDEEFMEAVTI